MAEKLVVDIQAVTADAEASIDRLTEKLKALAVAADEARMAIEKIGTDSGTQLIEVLNGAIADGATLRTR